MGARDLPAMDLNGLSDPYVKVKLGKHKFKTKVVKKTLNPYWGEEFCFRVEDLNEELLISVLDEDKYFNDDFVGHVKFPVSQVFDAHNKCLDTAWYPLQPKSKKPKHKDCGTPYASLFLVLLILHCLLLCVNLYVFCFQARFFLLYLLVPTIHCRTPLVRVTI